MRYYDPNRGTAGKCAELRNGRWNWHRDFEAAKGSAEALQSVLRLTLTILRRDGGTGRRSGLKRLGATAKLSGLVLSFLVLPLTYKRSGTWSQFGFVRFCLVVQRPDSYRIVTVPSLHRNHRIAMLTRQRPRYAWSSPVTRQPKFSPVATKLFNFRYRPTLQHCTEVFRRKLSSADEFSPFLGMSMSGQFVTCRVKEVRPHPSYLRHQLTVPTAELSAFAEQGDEAFREVLVITRDRFVIDGYAVLESARQQGRPTLICIELDLNEAEGLQWLLWKSRRSNGLNAFSRILLALDLEPGLKEKARSNQRAGGQNQGSSKLTEGKRLDVRSEVARAAGVSAGNVTKVKQLMKTQNSKLGEALRANQISIHKAWQWRQLSPEGQLRELELYLGQRGTNKVIRRLIKRHVSKRSPIPPDQPNLGDLLRCRPLHETGELASIRVVVIDAPENIAFLTKGALRILGSLEE
ncbi:MAG: hypothetical protein LAO22_16240 [Acidobacteriia bacterium]|nr:hypothetical protein [Terriglobia bacterium]